MAQKADASNASRAESLLSIRDQRTYQLVPVSMEVEEAWMVRDGAYAF